MDKKVMKIIDNAFLFVWLMLIMADTFYNNARIAFDILIMIIILLYIIHGIIARHLGWGWGSVLFRRESDKKIWDLYKPWRDNVHWIILKVGIIILLLFLFLYRRFLSAENADVWYGYYVWFTEFFDFCIKCLQLYTQSM